MSGNARATLGAVVAYVLAVAAFVVHCIQVLSPPEPATVEVAASGDTVDIGGIVDSLAEGSPLLAASVAFLALGFLASGVLKVSVEKSA